MWNAEDRVRCDGPRQDRAGSSDAKARRMSGRYFDAWAVGDRIEHALHRTVTETDNLLITTLTHNPQPLHLDADYAGATEFGRIVVNGIFTFGLMVGLSVGDTTLGTLVAERLMTKPEFRVAFDAASRELAGAGITTPVR